MIGESAAPRYEEGDTVYVDPRREPDLDAWCVFLRADRTTARVARLAGDPSAETWMVEQRNPLRIHELARSEWPYCHRIVGTHTP
jgi:phage repressor protein C with HTH and peptisase S24 domain